MTADDVETLLTFYDNGRKTGGFEAGIESALNRLLVSPDFLFRIESDPETATPGSAHRISDLELASRLSFFLWSTIPDDELLNLAERGALHQPATLERQVKRMLADPRSRTLVENFAAQWLQLRDLRSAVPDPDLFADFIERRFAKSGIRPEAGLGAAIVDLAGNLPYDVQRLAHEAWDDVQRRSGKRAGLHDLHTTLGRLLAEDRFAPGNPGGGHNRAAPPSP